MKKIPLTQSYEAIVDDQDYEELSKHKWHVSSSPPRPVRDTRKGINREGKVISMSRQVMNAPDHLQVDHINGNTFDNRRGNLRLCTNAENSRNQKPQYRCSSAYKGVSWDKKGRKWHSYIKFEQHRYTIGYYEDERQAALFYDLAAIHFFKEFARFNFPEHKEFYKEYWKSKKETIK